MDENVDGKFAAAAWPWHKASRCGRSILCSYAVGCGMFARAFVQYPGIVFPGLDRLRHHWHPARECRPRLFCAHQAGGRVAVPAHPGLPLLDCVLHLHSLALVLQLIRKEMRCPKTPRMRSAAAPA